MPENIYTQIVCKSCNVAYNSNATVCLENECSMFDVNIVGSINNSNNRKYILNRLGTLRARAIKKRLDFNLDINFVNNILISPCVYCLSSFKIEFDRKDNEKGYTKDNVVSACHRCNTLKSECITYDEMIFISNYLGWRKTNA